MSLKERYEELLNIEEEEKTKVGNFPTLAPYSPPEKVEDPTWKQTAYEALGGSLWQGLDTAGFGLPGMVAEDLLDIELPKELTQAETITGKTGQAIGSMVGFIGGAPMKIGAKIASTVARPIIRGAGFKTSKKVFKGAKKALIENELALKGGVRKTVNQIESGFQSINKRANWNTNTANNFARKVDDMVQQNLDFAIQKGRLTSEQGKIIKGVMKDKLGKRPVDDFIDLFSQTMGSTNRKIPFTVGSIAHEAVMFGSIDAIFEGVHSKREDRPYDIMAPIFGVAIGSMFGVTKMLPSAGKASPTGKDFMAGLKAVFNKKDIRMKDDEVVPFLAKWLGDDMAQTSMYKTYATETITVSHKGKNVVVDLTNPQKYITEFGKDGYDILRIAMSKASSKVGRDMMKWAVTEDIKSSIANWPNMVMGTFAMNAPLLWEMNMNGVPIPEEDLYINIVLGAFLNRRGMPRTQDMDSARMRTLRRSLQLLGHNVDNMYTGFPTLSEGVSDHLNPVRTDPRFKPVIELSERLGIATDDVSGVNSKFKGESAAVSNKVDLFQAFYRWIRSASGKKTVKDMDNISEADALKIEAELKKIDWPILGNRRIKTNYDLETVIRDISNQSSNALESEMTRAGVAVLSNLGIIKNAGVEIDGYIPDHVELNYSKEMQDAIENGEVEGINSWNEYRELQLSINNIFGTLDNLRIATKKSSESKSEPEIVTINNPDTIVEIKKTIKESENLINHQLNVTGNNKLFKYTDYVDIEQYMHQNRIKNQIDKIANFADVEMNPDYFAVEELLHKAGILKRGKRKVKDDIDKKTDDFEHPGEYWAKGGKAKIAVLTDKAFEIRDGEKIGTELDIDTVSDDLLKQKRSQFEANAIKRGQKDDETPEKFYQRTGDKGSLETLKMIKSEQTRRKRLGLKYVGEAGEAVAFKAKKDGKGYEEVKDTVEKDFIIEELQLTNNVNDIEIIGGNESQTIQANKVLRSMLSLLGAKNRYSRASANQKGDVAQIDIRNFENIIDYMKQSGIAVNPSLLHSVMGTVVNKLVDRNVKDSRIGGFEAHLLLDLATENVGLVEYNKISDGNQGFTLHKLQELPNNSNNSIIQDWNKMVDEIHRKGKTPKGDNVVTIGEVRAVPDNMNTDNFLNLLQSRSQMIKDEHFQASSETIKSFVKIVNGPDEFKLMLNHLSEYKMNDVDVVMSVEKWLIDKGIIRINKKDPRKKELNLTAFEGTKSLKIRNEFKEYISKLGISESEIQLMAHEATETHRTVMSTMIGSPRSSKTISTNDFMAKYFPTKYSVSTPDQVNKYLNDLIRTDGVVNDDVISNMVDVMEFKVGDKIYKGIDLDMSNSSHRKLRDDAKDDARSILATKLSTRNIKVLHYNNGNLEITDDSMFDTPFTQIMDQIGLNSGSNSWMFLNPTSQTKIFRKGDRKVTSRYVDIIKNMSEQGLDANNRDVAKQVYNNLIKDLSNYSIDGVEPITDAVMGYDVMAMGSGIAPMAIKKSTFNEINTAFMELYNKYELQVADNLEARTKLESLKKIAETSSQYSKSHLKMLRLVVVDHMLGSSDGGKFLDFLTESAGSNGLAKLAKRVALFNTRSMWRPTDSLLKEFEVSYQSKSGDTRFDNLRAAITRKRVKGGHRVSVFDDELLYEIKDRYGDNIQELTGKHIDEYLNGRGKASWMDSIAFISKSERDYMRAITGNKDATAFKNHISSQNGKSMLYGKTILVYDPYVQDTIFSKNKDLDILLTKSGAKLMSKKFDDNLIKDNFDIKDWSTEKGILIPLESMAIGQTARSKDSARISISDGNYFNMDEARSMYEMYYDGTLKNQMELMGRYVDNQYLQNVGSLEFSGIDANLLDLNNNGKFTGGVESLMNMVHWSKSSAYASPMALGEDMVMNMFMKKFIRPILEQRTENNNGDRWGGKAVIIQSLDPKFAKGGPNELMGTVVVDGKVVQYGDIMLSDIDRESPLSILNKDGIEPMVITYNNEVLTIKEFLDQIHPQSSKNETYGDFWKIINDGESFNWKDLTLEQFKDAIENTFAVTGSSVGIMSKRYPRTKPTDIMIHRLKGFLDKSYGENIMVNPFDVWSVMEGDYDYDKADYSWLNHQSQIKNTMRNVKNWVPSSPVEQYENDKRIPNIELGSLKGDENDSWMKYTSDIAAFKGGIGTVQKTMPMVNHVSNMTDQNGVLMRFQDPNNKDRTIEIVMEWSPEWFQRSSLESQLLIDFYDGVPSEIAPNIIAWRRNSLFPTMEKSITFNQLRENSKENIDTVRRTYSKGGDDKKRVRLFRKFFLDKNGNRIVKEDGKFAEDDLNSVEIDQIYKMMTDYGKLQDLTTNVYSNTGESHSAKYKDFIEISRNYFRKRGKLDKKGQNFIDGLTGSHFYSSINKYRFGEDQVNHNYLKSMFGATYNTTTKQYYHSKTPFVQQVIDKSIKIANGEEGSVLERVMHRISSADPLNARDDVLIMGDKYRKMNVMIETFMHSPEFLNDVGEIDIDLESKYNTISEIQDNMTSYIKDINGGIASIKNLKRKIYSINKSDKINDRTKKHRIDKLNEIILAISRKIPEFLPKGDILRIKNSELGKGIKVVDILDQRDAQESLAQYMTLEPLIKRFNSTGGSEGAMYKYLKTQKEFERNLYSDLTDMGHTLPYGKYTSMHGKDPAKELMMKEMPTQKDAFEIINEMVYEGLRRFGPVYLYHYGMPTMKKSNGEVQIGIINGKYVPLPAYKSNRYKRSISTLIKASKEMDEKIFNRDQIDNFKKVIKIWSSLDGINRRFASGRYDQIPGTMYTDPLYQSGLIGMPGFQNEITSMYSPMDKISIGGNSDPYGYRSMNNHLRFMEMLFNASEGHRSKGSIDKVTEYRKLYSEMFQIAADNKDLPLTDYLIMTDRLQELTKDVFHTMYGQGITTGGKIVEMSDAMKGLVDDPIHIMLGGGVNNGQGVEMNTVNFSKFTMDQMSAFMEGSRKSRISSNESKLEKIKREEMNCVR